MSPFLWSWRGGSGRCDGEGHDDLAGKGRILTALVKLTERRRDYARAALREVLKLKGVGPLAVRYRERRQVASSRGCRTVTVTVTVTVTLSLAMNDRWLAPDRAKLLSRGLSIAKPGTLP